MIGPSENENYLNPEVEQTLPYLRTKLKIQENFDGPLEYNYNKNWLKEVVKHSRDQFDGESIADKHRAALYNFRFRRDQNRKLIDNDSDNGANGQATELVVGNNQTAQVIGELKQEQQMDQTSIEYYLNQLDNPEYRLQPNDLVTILNMNSQQSATSKPVSKGCALRGFRYRAINDDGYGNNCTGEVEINICAGSCVTSDFPDYTIPYKRSYHTSCNFDGQKARVIELNECSSPKAYYSSLRYYRYIEPVNCKCKTCKSKQALCLTT